MSVLLLIGLLWGASALIRAYRERMREREFERVDREIRQRKAEAARLREEWRRREAETKAETARLIALEREQMRIAREQEPRSKPDRPNSLPAMRSRLQC